MSDDQDPVNSLLKEKQAVYVRVLIPNTPAAKSGLKVGDRIVGFDGLAIESYDDYIDAQDKHGPEAKLDIIRGNQYLEITLKYEE